MKELLAKQEPLGTNRGHLGPRTLTVIHAVGQALAVGPIFSAGVLTSLVASVAGYSAPLSVLLGSLGAIGLSYVVGIFARRFAGAGAVYEYLARGATPALGVFGAGLYFLGTLFLGAGGIYLALGFFTNGFLATHVGIDVHPALLGAAVLVMVFVLNHYGVNIAVNAVLVLAGISAIPFVLLAFVIVAQGGADGNTLAVFTPRGGSWLQVYHGILFAVTLFIGFEAAASIAEESKAPRNSIPVAVVATVAVAGLFYMLIMYAATIGFGEVAIANGAWSNSASPLGELATRYVGSWLSTIMDLAIILDMISLAIAIMVTASRGFFALGRDGLLPRWLARTSRYNTPLAGNLLVVAWSILLLIWGAVQHWSDSSELPDMLQTFIITAATGSYLVELVYLVLALVALRILWQEYALDLRHWWRYLLVLVGAATPILAFRGSLWPIPAYPDVLGVWLAGIAVALAAVWTWVLVRRAPERVQSAAAYATEVTGD